MSDATIFHNPSCGTSRNTLALLRHAGLEPTVVEYLKTPPTKEQLRQLLADMKVGVRDVLRSKEPTYQQLGLGDAKWTDEQLLEFIGQHPVLLQRPIVRTARGTAMCRPSERVLRLLPVDRVPPFTKEDGDVVVDDGVRA
ncbi:arsenate reductase (glutaredoxin) [Ramlibacter algicola]|jgi:arsenate reductase (glutaredoxin)|uniref:Arsenate reductase n=1 Tax=Ramlibacter algicola TaxID=2795217 RepID=A0A934URD2_9BURK|nr:arsenate reductase (glutaredoxin) [Ramlibacter algicola]MBK0392407.1 arsenate reductase (glutaredoxin) [Ramlibacter algicola]